MDINTLRAFIKDKFFAKQDDSEVCQRCLRPDEDPPDAIINSESLSNDLDDVFDNYYLTPRMTIDLGGTKYYLHDVKMKIIEQFEKDELSVD